MGPVEAGIPRTTPASPAPASRRWQALQQASKASPSSTVLGRSTVSPDRGAASLPPRAPVVSWNRTPAPARQSPARSARALSRGPAALSPGRRASPSLPKARSVPVRGPGDLPRLWRLDPEGRPRAPFVPHPGTSGFLPLSSVHLARLGSILRPFTVPSDVRAWRRASQASACERLSRIPSRLEDGPEDGEPAFPHLDRVFLHRVIDRSHLLDLEIPHELPSGPIQSQHHDAIDEKPLVSKELTLPVRRPLHDHETGEFVVPEHLEEVEHPLPHVGRVLHERVERAERVEGEQLEFVAVHLAVVTDHPFDEGEVVRLVVRADDRIDLPEVREVADLHVHRELDAEGLHVP